MNISMSPKNERIAEGLEIRTKVRSTNKADEKQQMGKQDKITISLQAQNLLNKNGGKHTKMERLMEQKQHMIDRRSNYISNALEKGMSPDVMKYDLEQIDTQIEELDKQINELQHEGLSKATGMVNEDKKEEVNNNSPVESKQGAFVSTSNTMKGLISSSNKMKQVNSVKMAQLTLHTESITSESDPERSSNLKNKAAGLNDKLINISQNVNSDITHNIEIDKKGIVHHHQIESDPSIPEKV